MSKEKKFTAIKGDENKLLNIFAFIGLFLFVLAISYWVGVELSGGNITILVVFMAAFVTALATGFGAVPFIFFQKFNNRWLGIGNSIAAGLMFGASVGLVYEGVVMEDVSFTYLKVAAGTILGAIMVYLSHQYLEKTDESYSIGNVQGANAIKMLMIVAIMTMHSFAEGVGVGVSFGESSGFGAFISVAIAIHNIPEGLAISLILIPRGTSVRKAAFWSIFSSLPQPIMAIPAFLFVLTFKTYLPIGLGFAAGAMFWMVFNELIPEAKEELSILKVYAIAISTAVAMIIFQLTV